MIQTQLCLTSQLIGMEGKNSAFSTISGCSPTAIISVPSLSNTMTKNINIIPPSTTSVSSIPVTSTNLLTAAPPITINITHVSSLPQSTPSLLTPAHSSTINTANNTPTSNASDNTNINKPSVIGATTAYQSTSSATMIPSSVMSTGTPTPRPTSISISNVAAVSSSSMSPISSSSSISATSSVAASTYCTGTLPPLLSHVHIPRGAAVVANMASSRSSLAVTASTAQRGSSLPNRGIHLSSSSWGRANTNTIITCGSGSNTSSPIITTIPTTSNTIATTKFTRLPGASQLSPRQPANVTSGNSNIIRPTSITRVTTTTSLVTPNTTGGIMRNISGGTGANNGNALLRNTGIPPQPSAGTGPAPAAATRAVLATNRNSGTAVRPSLSSSVVNHAIRLTQTNMGPVQRTSSAVTSYSLTSLQRPVMQGTAATVGIRPRSSTSSPRFPNNQSSNVNLSNRSNFPSSPIVSSSTLPSRPQSNPGLSSATRPVLCANRPASTGPASCTPPLQTVRSTGLVRGYSGSTPTGTFVRATEGNMAVRPASMSVSGELRTAGQPSRQQPQQYLQMINSPNMQKVSCLGSSNTVSVVSGGGGRGAFNTSSSSLSPGTAPIAVRITSSPAVTQVGNGGRNSRAPDQAHHNAAASTVVTGAVGPAAGCVGKVMTGGNAGCAAASAAAAVLPPGTTITPAVLPLQHHQQDPLGVYLQKTAAAGNHYGIGQQQQPQQYYVDPKTTQLTVGGSTNANGNLVRCASSTNNSSVPVGRRPLTETGCILPAAAAAAAAAAANAVIAATPQQQAVNTGPPTKPTASPRPSILRRRPDYDVSAAAASKACKNLSGALSCSVGGGNGGCSSGSSPPSPKRPDSSGGNSGGSTGSATLSADSSPGLQIEECEPTDEVRQQPPPTSAATSSMASIPDGISPRKKPRKQQLTGNELQDAQHTSDEEDKAIRPNKRLKRDKDGAECDSSTWPPDGLSHRPPRSRGLLSPPTVGRHHPQLHYNNNADNNYNTLPPRLPSNIRATHNNTNTINNLSTINGSNSVNSNSNSTGNILVQLCNVSPNSNNKSISDGSCSSKEDSDKRKKRMNLNDEYNKTWRSRSSHFLQHDDVKCKEDKMTMSSMHAGQKVSLQKLEGWKIIHVGGQVAELVEVEKEVSIRLKDILETLEARSKLSGKVVTKDMDQVCELIKANVQRSKIIHDQMAEAQINMSKLFVHKDKVSQLITKYSGRRQLRNKDKR